MAENGVMRNNSVPEAIAWQADHARKAGAPNTARVIRALLAVIEGDTATGRRMANWHGLTLEDAMPLRVAAGLHALCMSGEEDRLGDVYAGLITDQGQVDAIVTDAVDTFDFRLMPWLDSPPQTNEAGRSASVMGALLWLSERLGPAFELNEIGASAGINTMLGRFAFDLGGVRVGPSLSSMTIAPEWRGAPPPAAPIEIVAARGCDQAPVDLRDEAQLMKLKAYVWPEASERMARLDTAAAMAERAPPELVRQSAGEFVAERLRANQAVGVTRVLFHTIVWQYLSEAEREAITKAMEQAGAAAGDDTPLAWVRLETNRETFRHELSVRCWPGGDEWTKLAEAHPHGEWVEWMAD
ncbi:MAG: DUF2332 domain-containing protein [Alteraurantiacibacter sp.]